MDFTKFKPRKHPEGKRYCFTCKRLYPLSSKFFPPWKKSKSGLGYQCRKCHQGATDKSKVQRNWYHRHRVKLRKEVIAAYGGKCACCGETESAFLVLDHKKGRGNQHRKAIGGHRNASYALYLWVRRHHYPKSIQLLCANCNTAKAILGKCPHIKSFSL